MLAALLLGASQRPWRLPVGSDRPPDERLDRPARGVRDGAIPRRGYIRGGTTGPVSVPFCTWGFRLEEYPR